MHQQLRLSFTWSGLSLNQLTICLNRLRHYCIRDYSYLCNLIVGWIRVRLVRLPTPHRRFLVRPLRVVSAVGRDPLRAKATNGKQLANLCNQTDRFEHINWLHFLAGTFQI